jgi:hypothetical protein
MVTPPLPASALDAFTAEAESLLRRTTFVSNFYELCINYNAVTYTKWL